jgi:patatin-like phospholipase/acyl hydrolase
MSIFLLILTLDSGGIRGIVELEVLRAIQREVGDRIPIRAFFDLIVGTRCSIPFAISIS